MIELRQEEPDDISAIRSVNEQAFGRVGEADLVDALRSNDAVILSMVAVDETEVVGHILFSPVTIESVESSIDAIGLGPMAVLPSHQRRGVGSMLVRTALEELRFRGHSVVAVLGHPWFYPKFGFVPSRGFGIGSEYDVPDEVFMIAELNNGALEGRGGLVKYRPEFAGV